MKKILSSLTLTCILAASMAAFAQDQMQQQDTMKKDDSMKNDQMKPN